MVASLQECQVSCSALVHSTHHDNWPNVAVKLNFLLAPTVMAQQTSGLHILTFNTELELLH